MPRTDRTAVIDADFYLLERSLEPEGRQFLHRVREFMERTVQPVINHYWTREEFPYDLVVNGLAPARHRGPGLQRGTAARTAATCWTA